MPICVPAFSSSPSLERPSLRQHPWHEPDHTTQTFCLWLEHWRVGGAQNGTSMGKGHTALGIRRSHASGTYQILDFPHPSIQFFKGWQTCDITGPQLVISPDPTSKNLGLSCSPGTQAASTPDQLILLAADVIRTYR